jgi:hypothetical protein
VGAGLVLGGKNPMDHDSARLHCAVHCRSLILVKKKVNDTCFHNHTVTVSTWNHAEHVDKNGYLTMIPLQENVANTKSNCSLLQTCGIPKTVFPT